MGFISTHLSLPLLLLFLAVLANADNNTFVPCTICQDGSPPTGDFSGDPCSSYEEALSMIPQGNPTCLEFQMQAFRFCNCPTFPSEHYCALCGESGFFDLPNPRRKVPILNITCEEILFSKKAVEGLCEDQARAAYYCRCPNATRSECTFCPDRAESIPRSYRNRRIPPTFEYKCVDFEDAASLFSNDQCSSNTLGDELPVDLHPFCGCSEMPSSAPTCSLCRANETVLDKVVVPEMAGQSCSEIAILADFVNDANYCSASIQPFRVTCCNSTELMMARNTEPPTAIPVAEPTAVPVVSPTAAPVDTTSTDPPSVAITVGYSVLCWGLCLVLSLW